MSKNKTLMTLPTHTPFKSDTKAINHLISLNLRLVSELQRDI